MDEIKVIGEYHEEDYTPEMMDAMARLANGPLKTHRFVRDPKWEYWDCMECHQDMMADVHAKHVEPQVFVKMSDGRDPKTNGSRWYILPTESLRDLIIRNRHRLESRVGRYNYVLTWKDTQGYGVELAHADWVCNCGKDPTTRKAETCNHTSFQ